MGYKRSLIIPAFNEAKRIGATLEKVARYLGCEQGTADDCEVIVVCDGCDDATEEIVRNFRPALPLRVLSYRRNRGKGFAVRRGMAASSGRLVAFMDADGATPVEEFGRLSAPIREGVADVVVGSRRVRGSRVTCRQSVVRHVLGGLFAWHAQAVLGLRIRDTQCGFKVFDGDKARDLFRRLSCDGFAFDLELLAAAKERGFRVVERGVDWHEVAGSTVRPLRDGFRMVLAVWRIRRRLLSRRHPFSSALAGCGCAEKPLYSGSSS